MLAHKSRENLAHFDVFECLSCHSVISEAPTKPQGGDKKS